MKKPIAIAFAALLCGATLLFSFKTKPVLLRYQDTALSIEQRVNDLVSRMTLEEKVGQMLNSAPAIERLGVPAYNWWNECLHGVARTPFKVTVYPQAIGMAATWDRKSMQTMGDYTAEEGRAIYNQSVKDNKRGIYLGLTYWTPNINIFRDPRWGRGQETYGEDPYLTGEIGRAFVTGLQGNDPKYLKAAACAKHYAVHSGSEAARHKFNTDVSDYDLWDTYLPAFKKLVVDTKVAGVMCAYNALKGQPCCGNDLLMTSILRNQWKFTGYVTSDCGAIDDFYMKYGHQTHLNAETAAADAVLRGTDVECGNVAYKTLLQAVNHKLIGEEQINISLKRLFTIRFRLGMFDPAGSVSFNKIGKEALEAPTHTAQALKMARQSIVLLKNDNNLLPLSKNLKKVAVVGPNADNDKSVLGNYNGTPTHIFTALEGIKAKLAPGAEVIYDKGVDFVSDSASSHNFSAVINKVKDAEVIIYVGGISPQLEGEEMKVNKEGFFSGDRTSIMLPGIQTEFLKALKATGKPVVFIMMTGSAIAIPWEAQNLPAIVNAWYGGQAAGTAIGDVLFGDYNPAGRLPVTFYASDKDLPAFQNYSMANRTYRYFKGKPLFSFGYGLSFSKFEYSEITAPASIGKGKNLQIRVKVINTSKRDGEEVTQLYITHPGLKQRTAIRALKGFERTFIKAGQTAEIVFNVPATDLAVVNDEGQLVNAAGKIQLSVGGSQPDGRSIAEKRTVSKMISLL